MMDSAKPAVFTIPAHRAFADALAAGLLAQFGKNRMELARGIVLVPTNRAARAISDAFVRRAETGLLLPRLVPIGDPDLGERLGCGAHLHALRRTASGRFRVEDALPFEEAERLGHGVAIRLIPPAEAVGHLPAVTVNEAGLRRVVHGNPLTPNHLEHPWIPAPGGGAGPEVRVLGPAGELLALAHSRGGLLHPAVVLG